MRHLLPIVVILLFTSPSLFAQCPTISVIGPFGVSEPGYDIVFRVVVDGGSTDLGYSWSVNYGTITAGQGTPAITVATDRRGGQVIKATVKIDGLPAGCETEFFGTVAIAPWGDWDWTLGQYGRLKPNEERARLDTFFAELSNNPTHYGLIVLRITADERRDAKNRRLQFIVRHVKYRGFDLKRLKFALERSHDRSTIPVRMVPGGDMPPCVNCLVIEGRDFRR